MTKFKDSKGREFSLALTIGRARSVLDRTGIDLLQPESCKPTLPEILMDEYKIAEILEVLLQSEFTRLGLDPANMLQEDWDGATSQNAYKALLEELASFFEARAQPARSKMIRKTLDAVQTAMRIMDEKVSRMDPAGEVRRRFDSDGQETPADGNTSGRPQEEPALTPKA